MQQHYEMLYIMPGRTDVKTQELVFNKTLDEIKTAGGQVTLQEKWGNKKLSYEINHEKTGFYVLLEFDLEKEELIKVDKNLKLMPEILRYQIVKKRVKTEKDIAEEKMVQEKIEAKKIAKVKEKIIEKEVEKAAAKPKMEVTKKKTARIRIDDLDKQLDEILKEEI